MIQKIVIICKRLKFFGGEIFFGRNLSLLISKQFPRVFIPFGSSGWDVPRHKKWNRKVLKAICCDRNTFKKNLNGFRKYLKQIIFVCLSLVVVEMTAVVMKN